MNRWARLRALSWSQRALLLEALVQLSFTAVALRVGPKRLAVMTSRREARPASASVAREIARLVEVAARHGVMRPSCLQRSVALWRILRRHGIESELHLGARRCPDQRSPVFHAWVECNGVVLNDRADVRGHYVAFEPTGEVAEMRFD